LYAGQRYQADPLREAVDLIKAQSTPDRANVLFDRVDTYERLAPFMPGWSQLAALQLGGKADAFSAQKIESFSAEKPEVWYVLDFGVDANKDQRQAIDRRLSDIRCKVSQEFAGSAQVSHLSMRSLITTWRRGYFREGLATIGHASAMRPFKRAIRSALNCSGVRRTNCRRITQSLCTYSIKAGSSLRRAICSPAADTHPPVVGQSGRRSPIGMAWCCRQRWRLALIRSSSVYMDLTACGSHQTKAEIRSR
jgi:hypothetical protein